MHSIIDKFLAREKHVCPWYCCFTFDNIFRRLVQKPEDVLKGLVKEGMTALDIGPGMGYFSIPMAKLVGPGGKILALDVQEKMLSGLKKRAVRSGVEKRIDCRLVRDSHWGIADEADFALSFWMVHEVPNQEEFLNSVLIALKAKGQYLIAEPKLHVSPKNMDSTIGLAKNLGFQVMGEPKIFFSRSVLLQKPVLPRSPAVMDTSLFNLRN